MFRHLCTVFVLLGALAYGAQAQAGCTAGHPNASLAESTPTSAFTDNGNSTVTHSLTGLMWQQCSVGQSGAGCATGSATPMIWSGALGAARVDTTAGYTDWRLPSERELESLVETCGYAPTINQTLFPATTASGYWSASSSAVGSNAAWFVDFNYGSSNALDKSYGYYVRLVRAGQSFDAFDAQPDTLPDIFTFTAQTGAALGSTATSNTITVAGVDAGTAISIVDGTYKINSGSYTAASGTVSNGNTVTVQQTASASTGTLTTATLTIGSSSAPFNVTTINAQATLTVNAPGSLTYGGATATLTSSGGSGGGAVTYSAGASTGCSVSVDVLSVTNASGTCTVTASKAADSNYLAATSSGASVTLNKASQTALTVTGPSNVSYGSTGSLTYSGGSGSGAVTFSAGGSTGCTVSGTTLSVTNASNPCAVTVSQVADNNYNAATSASYAINVTTPAVSLSPPSLTFPDQMAGTTSAAQTITLSNTGNAALSITSILPSIPVFAVIHNCGSSLAAGSSCSLSVTFSPMAAGSQPGLVTLTSNAPSSPHSVTVSGNGLASLVPVCSLSAVPARIQPDRSSTLTASCSPAASSYLWTGGTCAGTSLVNTCTVAPAASTSYGVTGINGNGSGVASAPVTVTVRPIDLSPILMLLLD